MMMTPSIQYLQVAGGNSTVAPIELFFFNYQYGTKTQQEA
jgi:hypothetical protein